MQGFEGLPGNLRNVSSDGVLAQYALGRRRLEERDEEIGIDVLGAASEDVEGRRRHRRAGNFVHLADRVAVAARLQYDIARLQKPPCRTGRSGDAGGAYKVDRAVADEVARLHDDAGAVLFALDTRAERNPWQDLDDFGKLHFVTTPTLVCTEYKRRRVARQSCCRNGVAAMVKRGASLSRQTREAPLVLCFTRTF